MKRPDEISSTAKKTVFLSKSQRQQFRRQQIQRHNLLPQRRDRESEWDREDRKRARLSEKELEDLHLGSKKPKKRVINPSHKSRFPLGWDNADDTSRDIHPLYQLGRACDAFDMIVDRQWSDKKLNEMTERDWRIFHEDFGISYKGSRIPRPMRIWDESKLARELLKAVKRAGYTKPSPIQIAAIPLGLQQRDVIGVAKTGSGKTAAFVLPMLAYISRLPHLLNLF